MEPRTNAPRFVTARELADLLNLTPRTVYRLGVRGKIPRVKLGSAVRYSLDALTKLARCGDAALPSCAGGLPLQALEPLILNEVEAAWLLRLVNVDDPVAARRRLNRLVAKGALRPVLIGGKRRYALAELRRFVARQTDLYGEVL